MKCTAALFAAFALLSTLAHAAPDTVGSGELSAPLEVKHSGDIAYVTGGIGLAERNYLASVKKEYSLEVEAALTNGEFIADVVVSVKRGDDVVLQAEMDGPHLYAALPEGKYSVSASYSGNEKSQTVVISKTGQRRALFIWKPIEAEQPASQKPLPDIHF